MSGLAGARARERFRHGTHQANRTAEKPVPQRKCSEPKQEEKIRCVSRMHCKAGPLAA